MIDLPFCTLHAGAAQTPPEVEERALTRRTVASVHSIDDKMLRERLSKNIEF